MEGRTPLELLFKWHDEICGRIDVFVIRHDVEAMYFDGIVVKTVSLDFHVAMFVGERLPVDRIDGNLSKRLQIFGEFAAIFMLVFHHLPGEHGNGPQIFDLIMLLDDCKIGAWQKHQGDEGILASRYFGKKFLLLLKNN